LLGVIILKAKKGGIMVMRKTAFLVFAFFVFSMTTAFAEIKKFPDKFTNGVIVRSEYLADKDIKVIDFFKYIDQNSADYKVYFSKESLKDYAFEKSIVEIKVDNNQVHKINVSEITNIPSSKSFPGIAEFVYTSINAIVPNDVIGEIKTAKRVAFCLHFTNGITTVFVVPDPLLTEWQQVINTEK